MQKKIFLASLLCAGPAFAASGPFFSLGNSNFVVLIAFIVFVGILLYLKVPAKIGSMLDVRATQIQAELEEARALREEAKNLLASYERKQIEVAADARRIVEAARQEAMADAAKAKDDLQKTIQRRLAAAEERISSAEAAAVREVRERAVDVAIGVSRDILAKQMTEEHALAGVDDALAKVVEKLH